MLWAVTKTLSVSETKVILDSFGRSLLKRIFDVRLIGALFDNIFNDFVFSLSHSTMVTGTAITYLLCVTVVCVNGFLPNRMSPMASTSDFTHQDITEIAILRSVAEMFEETSGRTIRPGELTGIPNITAKSLFAKYYGSTYNI